MLILEKKNFPISTDFKKKINSFTRKLNLKLKLNLKSGLIYLDSYWSFKKIVPKYDWIKYSEPEDHLAKMQKLIKKYWYKDKTKKNVYKTLCCSYKDVSFSRYFKKYTDVTTIGENLKYAGVEVCQDIISNQKINDKYDLVLARHIVEHTFNLNKFFNSLKKISNQNSIFYFEVPDVEKLLISKDYNLIWEDHTNYFTLDTFKNLLKKKNFKILSQKKIHQPFEDLICIIAKKNNQKKEVINNNNIFKITIYSKDFKKKYYENKKKIRDFFLDRTDKKIFIFGAGHLTNTFVHLNSISQFIDFIIDDNIKKRGMFFPNTKIKIISVNDYKKIRGDKICLIGANPSNENKIIKRLNVENCKFYSIFLNSKRYILKYD